MWLRRFLSVMLMVGIALPVWGEYFFTSFDAAETGFHYNFTYSLSMGYHNIANNYAYAFNTSTL
ncbi:MAG: hypothetical protein ACK4TN_07720, partial [Brevinematales bacterium]